MMFTFENDVFASADEAGLSLPIDAMKSPVHSAIHALSGR
jgi:hypothetical protein